MSKKIVDDTNRRFWCHQCYKIYKVSPLVKTISFQNNPPTLVVKSNGQIGRPDHNLIWNLLPLCPICELPGVEVDSPIKRQERKQSQGCKGCEIM